MEQDIKALVKIIILFQYEGLKWIDARLEVQGLYLDSSTGPAACSSLKDIFMVLSFQPLPSQQAVGILE